MIERAARGLAVLAGVFFLALGLTALLAPAQATRILDVLPAGNSGWSTLRGDLGGLFLGMSTFALVGAIGAAAEWLVVPVVLLGLIMLGRTLSLMFDGASHQGNLSLEVEAVLLTFLVAALVSRRRGRQRRLGLLVAVAVPVLVLFGLGASVLFQRQLGMALTRRFVERGLRNDLRAGLQEGLHVALCGTGSPMPDPTRAGPCVAIIAGKAVYVVDAGEGSPRHLALMGLSPGLIDAIFLTHYHSDHIGGLGEMLLQRWTTAGHSEPVPVIGPQGVEAVVQGLNAAYALDKGYRVAHHGADTMPPSGAGGAARPFTVVAGADAGQVVWQQDGLTVTAFPVRHTPVFPAVGYRFDYGGRSVVVSGDTAPSATLAKYAAGADVLLHEGLQTAMVSVMHETAVRNGQRTIAHILDDIPPYHTTPEDAARIAQQAGVRHLVFYHTIPPLPTAYLDAAFLGDAAALFKGLITVSKDGLLVSLPSGSKDVTMRELL